VVKKIIFPLVLALGFIASSVSADHHNVAAFQAGTNLGAANKVDGLELPANQTVSSDEGFLNIKAKTSGQIKWLVVSAVKVKYISIPQTNSIVISVPPQGGTITVFAVALVDGKLTDFARTNVIVNSQNGTTPPSPPNPPPVGSGPLHITFLVDLNNMTPGLAQILNSQTLRQNISTSGNFFRLYDLKSPIITTKKLDSIVNKVGGNAIIVIQRNDGYVLNAQKVPQTETQVMQLISKYSGGQ